MKLWILSLLDSVQETILGEPKVENCSGEKFTGAEIKLLTDSVLCGHPNMVKLNGYCFENGQFGVVYDLEPLDTVHKLVLQGLRFQHTWESREAHWFYLVSDCSQRGLRRVSLSIYTDINGVCASKFVNGPELDLIITITGTEDIPLWMEIQRIYLPRIPKKLA
ncbi:hypothetical protein Vadar_023177 [Vaccinium darrowii]|uniref:Uncharacterized protein n=1 Tax=Vaccinium darrowii TaxID=229202 RepID=A0ACB7Z767_9ERIC|nr:hypothetical protein Vadar_023177 [Vaccinium darrowii]